MDFWQGKEVRLRAIEPSDWELFHKWDQDSDRTRDIGFLIPPTSTTLTKAWVEEQSRKRLEKDEYFWVIENADGEAVGSIDTHDCRPRNGTFSYGIAVAAEHRRRGCASEAIRLVLRYYFDELRYQKVTSQVHSDNTASIGLHENLGFVKEGVIRRMIYSKGQFLDEIWFGMTAEEFRTRDRR